MKKIKENEEFQLGNRVFTYSINEGKIQLIPGKKLVDKKAFIPPKIEEVQTFFKQKGYKDEAAVKFHQYYTDLDWKDKNNEPVKNWKAKCVSVWFRPEHKIVEIKLEKPKTPGFQFFQ
jgi:hypothetical protein